MLHILGGLALAVVIIGLGGYAAKRVTEGVAASVARHMPAPARAKAAKVAGKASTAVPEGVRHIRARAWEPVKAQHWLERKQAARARREERRQNRQPRNWRPHLPRVAIHVPGVTDQPEGTRAQPAAPAPAAAPTAVKPATTATPATTGRPHPMPLIRNGSTPDHAALNARVAHFEPEDDGELIRFMSGEAAGMREYAEALEQVAEHLVSGIGLDPAAVQGIGEYAQAITECATQMTQANARFQAVYQGVRETVAAGVVMPHRGRFMTGEDG